jgi:hypothetical protein
VVHLGTLSVEKDGLRIVDVAAANLRKDDVVLQLNSHRLRSCSDLERALGEARRDELELMVLLQRGNERRTEWIRGWREQAEVEPIEPAPPSPDSAPPATARSLAAVAPPPTALPLDAGAARAELARQMALGRELQRSLPLTSAGRWIRKIDELVAGRAAPGSPDAAVRILSYYATIAEILAYRDKAARDDAASRNRAGLLLEYGPGSPVTDWLERYPFLNESVSRPYDHERSFMSGRRMGLWSPDEAVRLLVERALNEGEALDARPDPPASAPRP